MLNARRPPLSPYQAGHCNWCGGSIQKRLKKNGEPYRVQASWHSECYSSYAGALNPSTRRHALIERDGKRCSACHETPHSWEPRKPVRIVYWYRGGKACQVEWRLMLQVDHKIPLWKVARLPNEQRRWYFTLPNLWLLCVDCHKKKTAKEAAERAHLKRLAKPKTDKPKGRPMKSRGFRKDVRRRFNGTVEARAYD